MKTTTGPISAPRRARSGSSLGQHSEIDHLTLRRLRTVAGWMDSKFTIPGTNIRFGFDSILGFVPGIGDVVTSIVPLWIVYEAHRAGVSRTVLVKMFGNVAVDTVVGLVPVLGDVFDVYFKANVKNLKLFERELERGRRPRK